jgi:uncharacterized protein involved in exopolysaccharide biosynthesis
VFVLVLAASVIITSLMPKSYASTARIKIEPDFISGIPVVAGGGGDVPYAPYDPYFTQTAFEIIQDQVVLNKVITKLNLNVEWGKRYNGGVPLPPAITMTMLKRRLALDPVRNTKLIEITVYDEDKNMAANIANAIVEAYRDYRVQFHNEAMAKGIRALQHQYQQDEMQIQKTTAELEALRPQYKIGTGVTSPQSPQTQLYWDKKRELDQRQAFHRLLAGKIEAEKLDSQIPKPGPVEIVRHAQPGHWPVRPNKPLNISLGVMAGIFLASVAGAASALIAFLVGERNRKTSKAAG